MLRTLADALRSQALLEFELPLAPPRLEELPAAHPDAQALDIWSPAGRFLIIIGARGPLTLAFESTLFDLLHEMRYPAPPPRRARGGALIAKLQGTEGAAAAACYQRPPGEHVRPQHATIPKLLDIGRLLARLHQLAEVHPASVPDPFAGVPLESRLPAGHDRDKLAPFLLTSLAGLPLGAAHGSMGPLQMLFVGERVSGVLPSGHAAAMALVLDLAATALAWMIGAESPPAVLRAILSGYQSLRRLNPDERDALFPVLQLAAAREGAVRLWTGDAETCLSPLSLVEGLGVQAVRAAAG
ncbi:MAG: hypothetical protein JST92_07125 [Deltaproteobacteria bacterium]|nr:hypothetical protein [Deltaproteobacteria bacterium]